MSRPASHVHDQGGRCSVHSSRPSTVIEQLDAGEIGGRQRDADRDLADDRRALARLADGRASAAARPVGVGRRRGLGMGARQSRSSTPARAGHRGQVGRGAHRGTRRNRAERSRRRQQPEVPLDARSDRGVGRSSARASKSSACRGAAVLTSSKVAEGIRSTTSIAGRSRAASRRASVNGRSGRAARHQPQRAPRVALPRP